MFSLKSASHANEMLIMQGSVPPVMAFHLGSLGFLTPFKFESYKTEVAKVFEGRSRVFSLQHHQWPKSFQAFREL